MDLGLRGRNYLVTGGTRGLGRACAEELVRDGATVVIAARHEDAVTQATADLGGSQHAVGCAADVADAAAPAALVECAVREFGRLDGALINLGGPVPGTELELPDEDWRRAFETTYLGALRLLRTVATSLSDGGSVVLVLSSSVRAPIDGLGLSNGLRPGLAMAAKSMANQLGPSGVRINGLLPGRILTDRLREVEGDRVNRTPTAIPLHRYGSPDEFGRVAAFLLSPASSYLTGTMIPVDGGAAVAL